MKWDRHQRHLKSAHWGWLHWIRCWFIEIDTTNICTEEPTKKKKRFFFGWVVDYSIDCMRHGLFICLHFGICNGPICNSRHELNLIWIIRMRSQNASKSGKKSVQSLVMGRWNGDEVKSVQTEWQTTIFYRYWIFEHDRICSLFWIGFMVC